MAKDKDRSLNPAMAQRKSEKQKALKKSKADALVRRNEKLGRRNPDRIQRQISDIKSIEESGQQLRPRDKELLEALERDFRAVQKAREALGDKAPSFENRGGQQHGRRGDGAGVLGKRRRDDNRAFRQKDSDSSDTDESVRGIPMPRDTPPPIPQEYFRRKRKGAEHAEGRQGPHPLPAKPPVPETKTVYEAAPAVRNLREEAVNKFVPAAVRMKQQAVKGQGKLLEPEEMDRLEKTGYVPGTSTTTTESAREETTAPVTGQTATGHPAATASSVADVDADGQRQRQLEEEEERFNRELRSVQVEEVEDEEV